MFTAMIAKAMVYFSKGLEAERITPLIERQERVVLSWEEVGGQAHAAACVNV